MIYIKSENDIEGIRKSGKISKETMLSAIKNVKAGMTTLDLNGYIESYLNSKDAVSWFKEVDEYPYSTCISVNDTWLHGIPGNQMLKKDDVVSIDIGVKKDGYYVDNCWTVVVKEDAVDYADLPLDYEDESTEIKNFLSCGTKALFAAINSISDGDRIGKISSILQNIVENAGYSVIREYTGHGVGFHPHEDPTIPCYGSPNSGPLIKKGMVFAVEIMYSMKSPVISTDDDGWTVRTKDGSLTAMYEHTVAVTSSGVELLTA